MLEPKWKKQFQVDYPFYVRKTRTRTRRHAVYWIEENTRLGFAQMADNRRWMFFIFPSNHLFRLTSLRELSKQTFPTRRETWARVADLLEVEERDA